MPKVFSHPEWIPVALPLDFLGRKSRLMKDLKILPFGQNDKIKVINNN